MGKLRFYFTVIITKLIIKFMHLVGRNATDFPGRIALKLCPDILGRITPPKKVIAITGTNGKTSTNNITMSVLKHAGYSVIENSFGGNINSGIASILLTHSDWKGVCHQDVACLEIDERSAVRVYPYLKPDYMLVTNLQRDSMMRNAHVEYIYSILDQYIPESTKMILNGDDLISSQLGKKRASQTFFRFALQENEICRDNIIKDITVCPKCGSEITWNFVRNHSIGQGHCPNCDFGSPAAKYVLETIKDGKCTIAYDGIKEEFPVVGYRTSDYYNTCACIALLKEFGLTSKQIADGLAAAIVPTSRYQEVVINGKRIISILSKGMNAIACSNSCDVVSRDPKKKAVIMFLDDVNDAKKSSEMVNWIYDVDFEFLKDENITQIIYGGKRHVDYHIRFALAGIDEEKLTCIESDVKTPEYLDVEACENIYILFDMYSVAEYKQILAKVKEKCERLGK